jgi:hypothetical protein
MLLAKCWMTSSGMTFLPVLHRPVGRQVEGSKLCLRGRGVVSVGAQWQEADCDLVHTGSRNATLSLAATASRLQNVLCVWGGGGGGTDGTQTAELCKIPQNY